MVREFIIKIVINGFINVSSLSNEIIMYLYIKMNVGSCAQDYSMNKTDTLWTCLVPSTSLRLSANLICSLGGQKRIILVLRSTLLSSSINEVTLG